MRRINSYLHSKNRPPYVINLDPAVLNVPFEANIDIRDSVNYEEVMKQYNLGPNGGILTSLNLFATKVDQIVNLLEKRARPNPAAAEPQKPDDGSSNTTSTDGKKQIDSILVDTPGQIEVFVWSASGTILLESLASSFPTIIAYIIDTPRTASTSTFMSNMLYACSILYKTKLPMILVFNKTDVKDAAFAKEWIRGLPGGAAPRRGGKQRGRRWWRPQPRWERVHGQPAQLDEPHARGVLLAPQRGGGQLAAGDGDGRILRRGGGQEEGVPERLPARAAAKAGGAR